jgi:hypothetical protein
MRIEILNEAEDDLVRGFFFYEAQQAGLGSYFLNSIFSDIESLTLYAGIHRKYFRKYHRMLSKRFPYAIYYRLDQGAVWVHAILDCRRRPSWISKRLI